MDTTTVGKKGATSQSIRALFLGIYNVGDIFVFILHIICYVSTKGSLSLKNKLEKLMFTTATHFVTIDYVWKRNVFRRTTALLERVHIHF